MKTKLILKAQMKDGESLEVWAAAREVPCELSETGTKWQGGVGLEHTVTWFRTYGDSAAQALDAITKRVVIDVDKDGCLVIEVVNGTGNDG